MFNTNGNRRPNAVCSITIRHHGKPFNSVARLVFDMVYAINNSRDIQLVNKTTFDKGFREMKFGVNIDWKTTIASFESTTHDVLYNMSCLSKNKHEALMTVYIVSKAMLINRPIQKEDKFEATIDPTYVMEDTRVSTGPIISVFTTEDIDGVHYFRSKTEAMYYVNHDESRLSTVDCIRVGDDYFEVKEKLPAMKVVDVNEFKLFAYDSRKQKAPNKPYFKPKVQNDGGSICYSHDVDSFEDGFYKVAGHINGGIFIETVKSLVKAPVRTAYFFKAGTDSYREIAENTPLISSLKG